MSALLCTNPGRRVRRPMSRSDAISDDSRAPRPRDRRADNAQFALTKAANAWRMRVGGRIVSALPAETLICGPGKSLHDGILAEKQRSSRYR